MANGDSGWTRVPAILNFPDTAAFAETYGFAAGSGQVWLEGQYLIPRAPSKTLYLFMHPSGTLQLLPMPQALAGAGLHVLCAASRYPKNDSGLIMEKVAIDMGAWVRDARAPVREGDPRRLVGRRFAVAVLPGGGRGAVNHRNPGGRPGGPCARRSRTGRRRRLYRRASVAGRDLD